MISVVVPRAGDCPHRARAWAWVRAQYDGFEVVEGFADPNGWRKADAVADALTRATGDVLVVADADVWVENLTTSTNAVESGAPWAIPHTHVRRLTETGTGQFIAGAREEAEVEEEHFAASGGGIVILPRATYERVPLDRRFIGWGGEDKSWANALTTIVGQPHREGQALWHLWHPPQPRTSRTVGSAANDALRARYADARHRRRQMSELIEEARCRSLVSSPNPS